jgi:acetyl esterase/lipase
MYLYWNRRGFLGVSLGGIVASNAIARGDWLDDEVIPRTLTYKAVGDCSIQADFYGGSREVRRPIAVWIHGGALIMGDRRGIDRALLAELLGAGFVVVSIDYRLAPETKLPAILEDVKDALAWVRAEGPAEFGGNPERMVVLGGSAGGYLTQACGYLVRPRPRALVSFWGYGDIAGEWYSRPDAFYRQQPLVAEDEARSSVGSEVIAVPAPGNRRFRFYLYCRQNGLWPKEVAGHDPDADAKAFDEFCPLRNVSAEYPPTLLIHGTKDTDVPHEQSVLMDRELSRHGVAHDFISLEGAGHGLGGVDKAVVADVYRRVLAFLKEHSGGDAARGLTP